MKRHLQFPHQLIVKVIVFMPSKKEKQIPAPRLACERGHFSRSIIVSAVEDSENLVSIGVSRMKKTNVVFVGL